MWWKLAGLAVAALGVAATAGWLEFGRTRKVRHARALAELLALMPDGAAKTQLQQQLEIDVLTFLELDGNRAFGRWLVAGYTTVVITALGAGITTAMLLIVALNPDTGLWAEATVGVTTVVVIAAGSASIYVREKLRKIERASVEQAESATDSGS